MHTNQPNTRLIIQNIKLTCLDVWYCITLYYCSLYVILRKSSNVVYHLLQTLKMFFCVCVCQESLSVTSASGL